MGKYLKTGYLRNVEGLHNRGEISYGKAVQLIEAEVIRNYKRERGILNLIRNIFKDIWRGFEIAEELKKGQTIGKF